jgi:hypothetical protein
MYIIKSVLSVSALMVFSFCQWLSSCLFKAETLGSFHRSPTKSLNHTKLFFKTVNMRLFVFWDTDGTIGPMRRVTERILKLVSTFREASKKFTADFFNKAAKYLTQSSI